MVYVILTLATHKAGAAKVEAGSSKERYEGKPSMLAKLEHLFLRTNQVSIGIMMGIMFILVFVNVVTRYIFGFSFATTEEISTFLMIWITYIGAGLALREGRLAAIDLFQDMIEG